MERGWDWCCGVIWWNDTGRWGILKILEILVWSSSLLQSHYFLLHSGLFPRQPRAHGI
ncbi:hypothetical protein EAF04_002009 [Stromatinia cepivora]|nr:hypothetical protein EAF04_002009 [Stromatinia cepivora]